jgi:hypothetical protein
MAKLVMMFFVLVALVQIIKPIGWPGLKYRRDAWKLVVAGFLMIVAIAGLRPDGDTGTLTRKLQESPSAGGQQ